MRPIDPRKPKKPTLAEQYAAQVAARGGYQPLTGKSTGTTIQPDTNMYNAGLMDVVRGANNMVGKAGNFLVVEPAKSMGRTLSTRNIQALFNPKSSWSERANALTEDVVNIASIAPAARAGLGYIDDAIRNYALKKAIKRVQPSTIYDFGIHVSENPNIKNFVNSAGRENTSGYATDAIEGSTYHWTLTPERALPGEISFDEIAGESASNAANWTHNNNSTAYLTKFPMERSFADENFLDQYDELEGGEFDDLFTFIPSTRTEGPMEIVDSRMLSFPNQSSMLEKNAILEMVNRNRRKIALNNKRNQYSNLRSDLLGHPFYSVAASQQAASSAERVRRLADRRQRIGGL